MSKGIYEDFLYFVAKEEGATDYLFEHTPHEGLVMRDVKKVLVDFNDPALILHEIAHVLRRKSGYPKEGEKYHDSIYADILTDLVRKYMKPAGGQLSCIRTNHEHTRRTN